MFRNPKLFRDDDGETRVDGPCPMCGELCDMFPLNLEAVDPEATSLNPETDTVNDLTMTCVKCGVSLQITFVVDDIGRIDPRDLKCLSCGKKGRIKLRGSRRIPFGKVNV